MIVLGCDPGGSGAWAVLDSSTPRTPLFFDIPLKPEVRQSKKRKRLDSQVLKEFLVPYADTDHHVGLEDIWGFGSAQAGGQQGQFNFARDYGAVVATVEICQMRHTLVDPKTWQRAVGKKLLSDKEESIMRAIQLFPLAQLKKPGAKTYSHDRADALLIAYYILKTQI